MALSKTLSEQTYFELRKMIIKRNFKPGQKINEEHISDLLGVSRTTVKKAFTALVKDGLLEDHPRQGVYLKNYTNEEILEIYDLREVTAGLSARYAALRTSNREFLELEKIFQKMKLAVSESNYDEYVDCDIDFHEKIVDYSRAKLTSDIISNFHISLLSFNIGLVRDPAETLNEHRQIIDLLKSGNQEKAENFMRLHIKKSREVLAKNFKSEG